MIPMNTPNDKAKVTLAIKSYLTAKQAEKVAHEAVKNAEATLLAVLGGDAKAEWVTDEHTYELTATYGKTRSNLNAELIEKVLGVKVTDECYKPTKPWDELRIKVVL